MATVTAGTVRAKPLAADGYEKFLAVAAIALLATVLVALARGFPHWGAVPPLVWAHLATILPALALTPVMLLRPRGDSLHRLLGKIWVAAMLLTAIVSFGVRESGHGRLSLIHLISAYVILVAPLIWWTARTHNVRRHRTMVRGMVTGALLVAGFFTFPFGRMLGAWLFG
ncbi:MAG: hypothetical protein WC729_19440 [Sphingomonas sp.]|jgi:uncharacterized membrane protein|uniref:DUF2306 domain-containing protein n=1 Tax=Sphingomonas sp. TaxID=28214 RepID=UPI00356B4195